MKAFSLIELIFVIVIIGILSIIAVPFIPDYTLNDDAKSLINLINLKESTAMGYEANTKDSKDKKNVCITFTQDSLNKEENSSKIKYFFKSDISSNYQTVCFDKFGRVFKNYIDDEDRNLLHKNVTITLQYKKKNKIVTIHKITGFVE